MNLSRRRFLKTTGAAAAGLAATRWCIDAAVHEPWLNSTTKNELADIAVGLAKKLGATYGDIRINRYRTERISTRERQVQNVSLNQNFGFGVRVLVKGSWGFAASSEVTPDEVRRVTREAVDIAKANASAPAKAGSVPRCPRGRKPIGKSAFEQDPFDVSIEQKIETVAENQRSRARRKGRRFRELQHGLGERAKILRFHRRLANRTIPHSRHAGFHGYGGGPRRGRFPDAQLARRAAGHGLRILAQTRLGEGSRHRPAKKR